MKSEVAYNGRLEDLKINSGELIGLTTMRNSFVESPFTLAVARYLMPGWRCRDKNSLKVFYFGEHRDNVSPSPWTIGVVGRPLYLYDPVLMDGKEIPNCIKVPSEVKGIPFNRIYVGRDSVSEGLKEISEKYVYSQWMDSGDLIIERGMIGGLLEKMQLDFILPNRLRMKRKILG